MEPIAILQADLLDIVFENRNKEYGAYPLRKSYNRRLLFSTGVMLSVVGLFWLATKLYKPLIIPVIYVPEITLSKLVFPPIKPSVRPQAMPHATKPVAQQAINPIIVKTEIAEKPLPDNATMVDGPVGPEQSGVPGNGPQPAATAGAGTPSSIDSMQSPVYEKVFESAEHMPEFPGGMEALSRFLSRNLRAPDGGNDESVRVLARFIVNCDGFVTACEITTSGGPAFDREVLRVIHKMPRWKPGVQLNRPVSVYYRLPVQFNFQE